MGLDIRTNGVIGYKVFAVENGYISRIVTNYSGYDPESRTDAGGIGQVFYSAPAARTISIGLNLGF